MRTPQDLIAEALTLADEDWRKANEDIAEWMTVAAHEGFAVTLSHEVSPRATVRLQAARLLLNHEVAETKVALGR